MDGYRFDEEKAVNVVLFILKRLKKINRHKLAKILYFADQLHLVQYGRSILGDNYIAMKYGPVPSAVYDGIKAIDDKRYNFEIFRKSLISRGMFILPNADPDMDELSESEIKCLNRSIDENDPLNFDQLVDKSHALAWNKACRDGKMSVKHIAAEGGASKDVIDTIVDNLQDFELSKEYGLIR